MTYGSVTLVDGDVVINAKSHIAARLKRIFRRTSKYRAGMIELRLTDEVARDLVWIFSRYPMAMDADADATIRKGAERWEERAEESAAILAGAYQLRAPLAVALRDYQKQAVAYAYTNKYLLLGDDVGIGKTAAAIGLLAQPGTLPAAVVVPAHLPNQWARELARFLPGARVHIVRRGSPKSHEVMRGTRRVRVSEDHGAEGADVLIFSYGKLAGWGDYLRSRLRTIVFDEVQNIRHRKTVKYEGCEHAASGCTWRLGLSATPIYNYGGELWNIYNVLAPDRLGTQEEFHREWCVGQSGKIRIKDPPQLGAYLREAGLMLRRTRAQVRRELPPLSRAVEEIDSNPAALTKVEGAAAELARKVVATNTESWERLRSGQMLLNVLRQATGIAKAPYVAEFVRMLLDGNKDSLVLFGWHREVYGIWAHLLKSFKPAWYTGSESSSKKDAELARFRARKTRILLMSLRSGQGADGIQDVCSRVVFGELDWSPAVHEQCVGRAHRDGQSESTLVYYLTAREGSDPVLTDMLGIKQGQVDGVREPFGEITAAAPMDPDHVRRLAEAYLRGRG